MKGCIEHINNNWDADYFFSVDKKDFDDLVKNGEIETTVYSDWKDSTKKQLLITLHVDLKYWNESITQDLDSVKMEFSYKLLQMLMKDNNERFEHHNNLNWNKLIFFIKDSFQKQHLDHRIKTAEEKSNK
jgi:hypothetical protein